MSATSSGLSVSGPAIDVLIPAIEKDLATLPHVIDSLRRYVRHPISNIYIVSPNSSKIRNLCSRKNCIFVNETTVLPFTKKDIHYSSSRWNRSGWLYQQLLKMNGDHICRESHFLVIDADTVLIRPHRFRTGERVSFIAATGASRNISAPTGSCWVLPPLHPNPLSPITCCLRKQNWPDLKEKSKPGTDVMACRHYPQYRQDETVRLFRI